MAARDFGQATPRNDQFELERYRIGVKVVSCLGFWLQGACGFALGLLLIALSSVIPRKMAGLREECDSGDASKSTCQYYKQLQEELCQQKNLHGEECERWIYGHAGDAAQDFILAAGLMVLIMALFVSLVPLCGYCGARTGNTTLLGMFTFFCGLGCVWDLSELFGKNGIDLSVLPSFILPGVGLFFGWGLWEMEKTRRTTYGPNLGEAVVMREPLLAQGQYNPQPTQAPQQ
mmetsp:Transcript_14569/g.31539  ORF Transcript_14569/g.31539 Transcript_14569/m.31539 type:complete len:232 (-) Transcript_14569:93-788(-)